MFETEFETETEFPQRCTLQSPCVGDEGVIGALVNSAGLLDLDSFEVQIVWLVKSTPIKCLTFEGNEKLGAHLALYVL